MCILVNSFTEHSYYDLWIRYLADVSETMETESDQQPGKQKQRESRQFTFQVR